MPESVARRELLRGLLAAGHDEEVSRAVAQDPSLVPDIFRLLYHPDAVLRHRAAGHDDDATSIATPDPGPRIPDPGPRTLGDSFRGRFRNRVSNSVSATLDAMPGA